jgi:hypothetical protein
MCLHAISAFKTNPAHRQGEGDDAVTRLRVPQASHDVNMREYALTAIANLFVLAGE